jgi:hypothetical protein
VHISKSSIEPSSDNARRIRITAEVEYADGVSERLWYDFDSTLADVIDRSGSPWLAAMLPVAFTLGEDIRLDAPVDATLLDNARQLLAIWSMWYPQHRRVKIHAEAAAPIRTEGRCAAFFSGGVDSLFTILRRPPAIESAPTDLYAPGPIDDLICLWGFDIPLDRAAEFARLRSRFAPVAENLGCHFIDVASNLRTTRFQQANWGALSHASALISFSLFLGPRLGTALFGSAFNYRDLRPWGSHPLTDPLLSTATLHVVHDGAECTRVEKTRFLANSDVAMQNLRVCWRHGSDQNCSKCNKCFRTMIALELFGALKRCRTFDASTLTRANIKRIYSDSDTEVLLRRTPRIGNSGRSVRLGASDWSISRLFAPRQSDDGSKRMDGTHAVRVAFQSSGSSASDEACNSLTIGHSH